MLPNHTEAMETFWYWINERQHIYLRRKAGMPWPWTEDPILQSYHFCNVFRHQDAETKNLISRVINQELILTPGELLYNIFLFRAFNKLNTYNWLNGKHAFHDFHEASLRSKIEDFIAFSQANPGSETLYSGAYMLRGFLGRPKHDTVIEAMGQVWALRDSLAASIQAGETLQNAYEQLINAHILGWGEFTCYQVVLDLSYTSLLPNPKDINTWCVFGPGAKEGLRKIWPTLRLRETEMLEAGTYLLTQSQNFVLSHVNRLNLQDVEFSLCELSKYIKIRDGGRGRLRPGLSLASSRG